MNIRLTLINKLEISTSGLLITVLLTWVSLGTLSLTVCMHPCVFLFLAGQYKTKETVGLQRKLSHFGGFKVNGRGSLRGSEEIDGSLLSLLLPENVPEKGHGVNDSRELFQNSILGILQIGRVGHSSGLKIRDKHLRPGCVSLSMRTLGLVRWSLGWSTPQGKAYMWSRNKVLP